MSRLLGEKIKSVFVTGGAGFIGSHLVDRLLQEGYRVTVFDNLSSGRKENLAAHEGRAGYSFVEADLTDFEKTAKAMKGHDLVWHMAANTDIPGGFTRTDMDLKNCVTATYHVVEAMRKNGIRDLIFPSTGAVYGDLCRTTPCPENSGPLLPVSLYAAGKIASEAFVSAYCHLFGLRAWMFRFGNVIGSRMTHGVIFDFIQKLKKNSAELEILGDGNQEKNYFLVEECLEGMSYAFLNVPLTEEKPCEILNLGTDSVSNVKKIAAILFEEMGLSNVRIRVAGGVRSWPGDQPRVYMTVDKMKKFGWKARLQSDEAVRTAARRMLGKS